MTLGRLIALSLVVVAACTKAEPAPESAACCTNEATDTTPSVSASAADTADRRAALSPGDVVVRGDVTREGVSISVQNHAAANVKLKPTVRVERRVGDAWTPVVATGFALRFSCTAEQTECVTLAPGAELLPPLWPAVQGRGACGACEACPEIVGGEYRFVLAACDGDSNVASETFTLPHEP